MATRYIDRLAWGTDAGFYRLIPQEVLFPADEKEIASILVRARKERKSVTFRAAGTSLSGQAISDSILAVCAKKWERHEVLDAGLRIRVQPGVRGGRVNEILSTYGRRFTPDPASINSAMIGGIVMNNASGMSCGTHANSYRMLDSVRIVLADGTLLDTGDVASRASFSATHGAFLGRIEQLRDRTRLDSELCELVRRKYSIKNVTGLTILPFVEYDDPFDIIAHLIPGSEGTLAFLSEIVFRTGAISPLSESALLIFPTTRLACEAVAEIKRTGAAVAAEFFDRRAMFAVEKDFPELANLPAEAGALLVKIEAVDEDELKARRTKVECALSPFGLVAPARFTSDPETVSRYWAMRSGIFPAVGGTREVGTTCLIEDIALPIERLADATEELQRLFISHNYPDAVIYGHALDGNWHFILNQRFDTPSAIEQYDGMMRDVIELVVGRYGGSLKAEHGTGRNMAPFVRREWGDAAYRLMKDVKNLFDPDGILNPGVIFNEDPRSYVQNLKPLPQLDPVVDRCIECGFCEAKCVAHGYALSSRQRIIVQREVARLKELGASDCNARRKAAELERDFSVIGRDLCAGDGLCSTGCPIGINTGELIHAIRGREMSIINKSAASFAARHFSFAAGCAAAALNVAAVGRRVLGERRMASLCGFLHRISRGAIPLWTPAVPGGINVSAMRSKGKSDVCVAGKVVYFPSCINQRMGGAKGERPIVEDTVELLGKAGYEVIFPAGMERLCCGTIWESKGMPDAADRKSAELESALKEASENGKWMVLCDQSPCLHRMREKIRGLKLFEPAEFIERFVLDKVRIEPIDDAVAVHITCSTRKMGLADSVIRVAKACSRNVFVPEEIGCCAFAGDKGFTHPGLNAWALRGLRGQIEKAGVVHGYSNSRTCEIGLTTHSGVPYSGIAALVNRVATAK